jgi:RNA polymerase sigma-70 factor, ECF subfamily
MIVDPAIRGNEAALVARLRAGDEAAYEALFRTHAGAMMSVARRFLGDTDDAADAVQEAFVAAFRGMAGFDGAAKLGTWLHRITANACLMRLRARKRSRLVPLGDHPVEAASVPCPVVHAETAARVLACVDRLPDTYRTVVQLRDLEGLDTDATAARLGTSPGAVKVRLHRGRHALRALLAPVFSQEG